MYIPNGEWFDLFLLVFKDTGGTKFSEATRVSPARASWRGSLVWLIEKGEGVELNGEDIDDLKEYWKQTVQEASKEPEDGGTDTKETKDA